MLVVSGGVIAQQGTHEELLNAGLPRLPTDICTRKPCVHCSKRRRCVSRCARPIVIGQLWHEQAAYTDSWCSGSCRAAFRSAACRPLPKMGTIQRMTPQKPMTLLDQTRMTRCALMLMDDEMCTDDVSQSCGIPILVPYSSCTFLKVLQWVEHLLLCYNFGSALQFVEHDMQTSRAPAGPYVAIKTAS